MKKYKHGNSITNSDADVFLYTIKYTWPLVCTTRDVFAINVPWAAIPVVPIVYSSAGASTIMPVSKLSRPVPDPPSVKLP